jgi:hypothetical protein
MAMKTAELGDGNPYAPFRFKLSDKVAWVKEDGRPDPEMRA